jgi:hypothetical protein
MTEESWFDFQQRLREFSVLFNNQTGFSIHWELQWPEREAGYTSPPTADGNTACNYAFMIPGAARSDVTLITVKAYHFYSRFTQHFLLKHR